MKKNAKDIFWEMAKAVKEEYKDEETSKEEEKRTALLKKETGFIGNWKNFFRLFIKRCHLKNWIMQNWMQMYILN